MKKFAPLCLVALLPLVRAQEPASLQEPGAIPTAPEAPATPAPNQGRLVPRLAPDTDRWGAPVAPIDPAAPAVPGVFLGIRMAEEGARTLVQEVVPGSPAHAAGLLVGDRLLSVAGRPVAGARSVFEALAGRGPGDRVPLEVLRGGAVLTLEAELAARTAPSPSPSPFPGGPRPAPQLEPMPSPGLNPTPQFPGLERVPDMLRDFLGGGAGVDNLGGFDLRGWLGAQERQAQEWQTEVERLFRDLRVDLERDFDALRRELEGPGGPGASQGGEPRGWMRREFQERRSSGRPQSIPAEAWADLEQRLAPLEDQRRTIAREWAEAHGHPEWADVVPKFGVEVRIERREVQSGS